MSEDQRARRADLAFRILLLALAALWLMYPPRAAGDIPSSAAVSALSR